MYLLNYIHSDGLLIAEPDSSLTCVYESYRNSIFFFTKILHTDWFCEAIKRYVNHIDKEKVDEGPEENHLYTHTCR